jgi:hypothetical protein
MAVDIADCRGVGGAAGNGLGETIGSGGGFSANFDGLSCGVGSDVGISESGGVGRKSGAVVGATEGGDSGK